MAEQKNPQQLTEEFQKLQTELQDSVSAREKLESQQQENKGVQKEFDSLDDGAGIFKLVGPVLLKQERAEAVLAVKARLEFIEKEINRIEGQIKSTTERSEAKKIEIIQLQTKLQEAQQAAATG